MNISSKEGKTTKRLRMMLMGIGFSSFVLVGGVWLGANMMKDLKVTDHSPVAKGVTAPVISSVEISEVTNSTAVIRWKTNKATDSQVDYGTSEPYEFASELDTRPDTKHEIFLINLEPGLTYHFQVRSIDPVGNLALSEDGTLTTLTTERGRVSICGWDGDSIERVDTFCPSKDGWAKGESWTESCSVVWTETISLPVDECTYQFSNVKSQGSVATDEPWQLTLEPNYTGWIDVLIVESPSVTDEFLPAAYLVEESEVTMEALNSEGKHTFRFRPADDSASWSDLLTITVRETSSKK